MKGDKMAKRSSFGSIVRKRLSDITNSLPQPKSPAILEKPSTEDASSATSAKAYIDNLTKENLTLVKLIQDKNKIIELSGLELQKLRINLQKMQLQNWNLAQANSQMVAELTFGKEKLKSLQHELSCKDALLKAKTMELKDGKAIPAAADSRANEDEKPSAGNRRQRFTRSRSIGSSMSKQVTAKETAENKRRCLRRQSSGANIQQQENLLEIEDKKLSPDACDDAIIKHDSGIKKSNQRPERSSIGGRPLRKAAEKVHSYKEIALNSKMRRKD